MKLCSQQVLVHVLTVAASSAIVPCWDPRDATACLQAALNDAAADTVQIPAHAGSPWITTPLWIRRSNLIVSLEPGVVILAKAGSFHGANDALLTLSQAVNVTIEGQELEGTNTAWDPSSPERSTLMPTLRMRKHDYMTENYTKAEWRHGINIIDGSAQCSVSGIRVDSSGGDGFYVGNASDIKLARIDSTDNYRQGLSVIDVAGLIVTDSSFRNTNGTGPSSGIDLEPDSKLERLNDVVFSNIWSVNNSGIGFEVELSNLVGSFTPATLTIHGLHALNSTGGGLFVRADAMLRGSITIEDVLIDGTGDQAVHVDAAASEHDHACGLYLGNIFTVAAPRHGGSDPNGESGATLSLDNITIRGVSSTSSPIKMDRSWVPAHGCLMSPPSAFIGHPERRQYCAEGGDFGGLRMTAVHVEDTLQRPFLNASMECSWVPSEHTGPGSCGTATLANISGDITVVNPRNCAYSLGGAATTNWSVSVRCVANG